MSPRRKAQRYAIASLDEAKAYAAHPILGARLRDCTAHAQDGRAQTPALSAKGRRLVPEFAALADAHDAEFFDRLTTRIAVSGWLSGTCAPIST
jgi:uncharacterized protein (DUF1810 family)